MALHYVVQGHRFDIFENVGCVSTTYVSIPAIFLFYGPVAVVVLLTLVFSALAFRAFYLRRRTFTTFLEKKKSSFTARRYLRLMVITFVLAFWEALVMGLVFGNTLSGTLEPYTSWADVHSDFSRVDELTADQLPPAFVVGLYIEWWTIPISGFIFFCSFSFGEDAAEQYGPLLRRVAHSFTRRSRRSRVERDSATSGSSQAHLVSLTLGRDESVIDIRAELADTSSQSDSSDKIKRDLRASYEEKTDVSTLV
ncbi:pheromone A receptor-domain-containing protein [Mycena vitilis]|nr:pheromone A receptor-domain-containing protein [Mycena vitilis]